MIENRTVAAIIVAAGSSTRMGFDKLLYNLDGQTVLEKSLCAFDKHPAIDELVVVVGKNAEQVAPLLETLHKPAQLVQGGDTRAQSVQNGLAQIRSDFVAVHDAARPFVSQAVITAALNAAFRMGAAAPAVPVKDTVKVIGADGMVKYTPDRSGLYAVQTPQCFRTELYRKALRAVSNGEVTDDCSILELAGVPVQLTQGDYANYKITTREDLPVCREERQMHIGHGYDVHRLVDDRKLILGGVEISYEKGLLGHSDADVLTHAVMDSLLGAAALGDIGHLFPDSDPAYEGADSMDLLRKVGDLLKQQGWRVENLDATILCQAPKLAPHIGAMRENLSRILGMNVKDVSVKATTEEKLGFTGAGEGIAAHCVCLLSGAKDRM